MNMQTFLKNLKRPNVLLFFLILFLSYSSLIVINYYTIKILSVNRSYIAGESHYSKGQKEATRHLITYLYTQDNKHWKSFQEELKIPKGDAAARVALINNGDTETIKKGLRAGGNNEKDLDEMIWLFKNFHGVPFIAKAIDEWTTGDALIEKLETVGDEIHRKINKSELDPVTQKKMFSEISILGDKLTIAERNYADVLSEGARKIENYLIFVNIFFILIIISTVVIYYSKMVKKLLHSKKEIEVQNDNLTVVNKELDRFVYSASHDLRSPIISIKGLIEIAREENNISQIKEYLTLMHDSLSQQDQFISDIIDYSRNKRKQVCIESVSLDKLIDETIAQHQHIKEAHTITIQKNIATDEIITDGLRVRIILNNLISNAIKYSDIKKEAKIIAIKTYEKDPYYVIEIEDNGVGIDGKYLEKIFDMFFVTDHNMGSGLGLYIAKEAAEYLNGYITVNSEKNIGTSFTVNIPKRELSY